MIAAESYDWSTFEIVFYYNQRVSDLFRIWTTAAGLESFFIQRATFTAAAGGARSADEAARVGDRFRWRWRHAYELDGEVLGLIENREFCFTFGAMKVSVLFAAVGDRTEVHLVQSDIPDTAEGRVLGHLNCRSCWIFLLTNAKSVLDLGQDLRDADPACVSSMEVDFMPVSQRG